MKWIILCLLSLSAIRFSAQLAPATRPLAVASLSPSQAQAMTAGGWFDLAVDYWQAKLQHDDGGPAMPSPLMLIAVGQSDVNDPGTPRTLSILRTEADRRETPASRAFAYAHLAMCHHQLGEGTARNELLTLAMEAAKEVDSETLKPLVDLELISTLARTGQFRAASAMAHATDDPKARAAQFCAMALAAHERGDQTAAQEYLRDAQRLVVDQTEETTSGIWCKVGQAQAAMGDFHAAVWSVQMTTAAVSQQELLSDLARRQRRANDSPGYHASITAARESIERLPEEVRVKGLFALVTLQIELNDNGEWPQTIDAIKLAITNLHDKSDRALLEAKLAIVYAKIGDVGLCQEQLAAGATKEPGDSPTTQPSPAYPQVALAVAALASSGKVDAAESLAKSWPAASDMASIHASLAEAYARRGHFDDAGTHFDRLPPSPSRAWAARRIAAALVEHRQFEKLAALLRTLPDAEAAWASLGAAEGAVGSPVIDKKNAEFATLTVE